jgi:hypothetical protein
MAEGEILEDVAQKYPTFGAILRRKMNQDKEIQERRRFKKGKTFVILQMILGTELLEHRFLVLLVLELIEASPPQEPCGNPGQCYRRIGLVELTLDNSEWERSGRHVELRSRYRRAERELSEQPWPTKTLTLL